jgi:hypothetical protein
MPGGAADALTGLLPSTKAVAWAVFWFLVRATYPMYSHKGVRGFSRAIVDRLTYAPPPGMGETTCFERP